MFRRSKFLALTCILTISVVLMLAVVISFCLSGALSGEKPTLVFRSNSAKMVYDGSTLSDNGYSLLSGELKEGHRAKVNVSGLQEGVGKSENRLYVTILDELGADVTDDYDIVIEYGILEIKPVEIAIKTESGVKEYDGTPLVNGQWSLSNPEALMSGDRVEVSVTGSQTEIGTSFNTCLVKFFDGMGKDVSYNYEVKNEYGLLAVSKINLTVQSYPETVPYGSVAECFDYGYDDWVLLPGHVVSEVKISGRQEVPGSSPNTIDYVRIIDEMTGADVSQYYNIIKSEGILKVESDPFSNNQPLAYVETLMGGMVYLKDQSFGDYLGNSWAQAPEYYANYNGFSADYLTGTVLKNMGYADTNRATVSWLYDGFGLPYYVAMGELHEYDQSSDVQYSSSLKSYTVEYFVLPDGLILDHAKYDKDLSLFEREYRQFVYDNYTVLDSYSTREYMESVIKKNSFYGNDLDTIYRVANFIRNSAVYDLKFDTALDSEDDIAVAFLSQYKRGVCRHYATAATALYRAMGIPARYTEGFAVKTQPGRKATVTAMERHAWVEVYIDGMGWIVIDATGGSDVPEEEPIEFKITVNDKYVEYGKTLPEITYKGFDDYESQGYRFEPVFAEIPYEYGKHEIRIIDFTVYDPSGADVTYRAKMTEQKTGIMQIYRDILNVNNFGDGDAEIYEFVYDGKAHSVTRINCNVKVLTQMNRRLELVGVAQLTDVGEIPADYEVRVVDEYGNDVSDEYRISKEYAKLRVVPRQIEITIKDAKKSYDGKALTASSCNVSDGSLASGHKISSVSFTGSQTDIGCSEATLNTIVIVDAAGNEVQENYAISYIPGELRVTP